MKTKKRLTLVIFILVAFAMQGQIKLGKIIDRSINRAERSVENRIQNKIDKKVDKTLDNVEDSIFNCKAEKKKSTVEQKSSEKSSSKEATQKSKETSKEETSSSSAPTLVWNKYDFVPGSEIIFEDNLDGEQSGEFPSKWDLVQGSIENANFDNQNVIYFMKCNMNGGGGIIPLLKNSSSDYLPEEFSIEFDAYFEEKSNNYNIYLADYKNQNNLDKTFSIANKWLRVSKNGAEYKQDISTKYYPGCSDSNIDKTPKWRHVAISFNTRAMKLYLDDARILNIPNLGYNPTGITIGYQNPSGSTKGYIKNIRIAKGAVPLYDKFLTDGKFVTTGIKFDVNKATIKPESMGTINYVLKMMTDHPELSFSVEGHTDSDGEAIPNQKLSEARAKAVLDVMVKLGIDQSRLISTGHGESKPMTANNTPEAKAQNRRVEFVRM